MLLNRNLYQRYHKKSKPHKYIISEDNFTYRNLIRVVKKYMPKHGNALDVGSATGTFSFYLSYNGLNVDGVEYSQNGYDQSNINKKILKINKVSFFNSSIESFVTNKKYDFVVCFEVLEHLPDDLKVLKKINTLMKKNSILIISVPSVNAPLYKLGFLKRFDIEVGHLRRYSFEQIVKLCKKSNFVLIDDSKNESVLRNLLYTNNIFGWLIKFTKFKVINNLVTFLDNTFLQLFGESQIVLVCKKI